MQLKHFVSFYVPLISFAVVNAQIIEISSKICYNSSLEGKSIFLWSRSHFSIPLHIAASRHILETGHYQGKNDIFTRNNIYNIIIFLQQTASWQQIRNKQDRHLPLKTVTRSPFSLELCSSFFVSLLQLLFFFSIFLYKVQKMLLQKRLQNDS